MGPELSTIRTAFVASARERVEALSLALQALSRSPRDPEPLRTARASLRWLAGWAPVHAFPGAADLARRCDEEVTAEVLSGWAPDAQALARWRMLAASIANELAASPRGAAGSVLLTADASRPEMAELISALGPEVAGTPAAVGAALRAPSMLAVVLDLQSPISVLVEAVAAARAVAGPLRPAPAVVATGGPVGLLDRFRLRQAGVDEVLPPGARPADVARAVSTALARREVVRGTVFVLGADRDLGERLDHDLDAEGFRAVACEDLDALLAAWSGRDPDLILAVATHSPARVLHAIRELREDPHSRHLPIVAALECGARDLHKAAFAAGANDWIAVPYLVPELLCRVTAAIELRQALSARRGGEAPGSGVAAAARAVEGIVGALGQKDPIPAR